MNVPPRHLHLTVNFPIMDFQHFQVLVQALRHQNRFSLPRDTEHFVSDIITYAQQHKTVKIEQDTPLWRARLHDLLSDDPFPLEALRAPPPSLAGHGRLNPRGIPYLYLASDEETATSEVRPWKDAKLTLAEFRTIRPLTLANFSCRHFLLEVPDPKLERAENTWRELITWLFSAPFDPRDDTAYVPTQFIAERIKASNFDGIIYDSALRDGGYNIALFDPLVANPARRRTATVRTMLIQADYSDVPTAS